MSDEVETKLRNCPDGGTCHHDCSTNMDGCFRVISCVPLGAAKFPQDRWPEDVTTQHRARFLALRAARELAAYGAAVRTTTGLQNGTILIAETMGRGAVAFFEFQGEPFGLSIVPMANQDKAGPYFGYVDAPSSRSPE